MTNRLLDRSSQTTPIQCFNAATGRTCGFRLFISDLPADNPQQLEEDSHIGHQGKCKCRKCLAGGEQGFTATAEGYYAFYEVRYPLKPIKMHILISDLFIIARTSTKRSTNTWFST